MGAFQGHLLGDVLSVLLDAGVLFLLRWSLDDTSDGVVAAAIQGFAAILIVPSDKVHDGYYITFIPMGTIEDTANQNTGTLPFAVKCNLTKITKKSSCSIHVVLHTQCSLPLY